MGINMSVAPENATEIGKRALAQTEQIDLRANRSGQKCGRRNG